MGAGRHKNLTLHWSAFSPAYFSGIL